MKSPIIILAFLFLLTACGEKSETSKTNFNLKLGATVTNPAAFAGGMIISGRRLDGGQKFTLALTSDLELTLQKGAWEFITIAWTAPISGKKMTGPHICSYQQVEVRDDNQSITFNMNLNNCFSTKTITGENFVDAQFYSILNGGSSTIGFKKLFISECSSIDIQNGSCSLTGASSTYMSFKVTIPSYVEGIQASTMQDLSECDSMSSGAAYSNFQLPVGGVNGFIITGLKLFQTPNCTESATSTPSSYSYSRGLANAVPSHSMMSPTDIPNLANINFNYISTWTLGGVVSPVGRVRGDIYLVNATNTTVPPASIDDYVYFDGTNFQTINGANIKISNDKVYFTPYYVRMFVKP